MSGCVVGALPVRCGRTQHTPPVEGGVGGAPGVRATLDTRLHNCLAAAVTSAGVMQLNAYRLPVSAFAHVFTLSLVNSNVVFWRVL